MYQTCIQIGMPQSQAPPAGFWINSLTFCKSLHWFVHACKHYISHRYLWRTAKRHSSDVFLFGIFSLLFFCFEGFLQITAPFDSTAQEEPHTARCQCLKWSILSQFATPLKSSSTSGVEKKALRVKATPHRLHCLPTQQFLFCYSYSILFHGSQCWSCEHV